ncbi:uncharacterized protein PHALS_14700 [Plasmopara halstedii]|uniref:Uncharacterized protein n=1 Tax=Plasmopara halstedii TaxID=4781 RepID=A0A0P1AQB3_PLAHL|nr:uncharacterized protein PHALS_14700 [Plasmopara halstedii]CEG43300.1 hypothetical protein PHALS_14700 [Plasmopara halstedii]|eukprot:XP_024579669.1 hypothetical protein PHALS_14700 [Plasmopara halstedii]
MIAAHEVSPSESKMLLARLVVHTFPSVSGECLLNEEHKNELSRRGAVGRRHAVVELPVDILASIAKILQNTASR